MKLRIHEIKKETCKLLSGYFGLGVENVTRKNENKVSSANLQTPDFHNGRVNNLNRKNLSTTRCPQ